MARLAIASVLCLALAACGGTAGTGAASGAPSPSAPASVSAPSPSASAASPSASAGAASTVDACALLTNGDVAAVIGTVIDQPVRTAQPVTGMTEKATVCAWRSANGLLTLAMLTGMSRSQFDAMMRLGPSVPALTGIGDEAVGTSTAAAGANGAQIQAIKGTTYFTLLATSSSTDATKMLDGMKTLGAKVAGQL